MANFPDPPEGSEENRHITCQMAVERPLQDLLDVAAQRGWTNVEVLSAIIEVADNLMLAAGANAELEAVLSALRKNTPDE